MDLKKLLSDAVITEETFSWIQPLWEVELKEVAEVREAAATRINLFSHDERGRCTTVPEQNDVDFIDSDVMISNETIDDLEGVSFSFWRDDHSAGHGNRVWHASIAMCIYLKYLLQTWESKSLSSVALPIRSLELGAGTALPSLFLGHLMPPNKSATKPFIHITDGKQYRNLRQILLSLSKQPEDVHQNVQFRVSPHNWGQGLVSNDESESNSFFDKECHSPFSHTHEPFSYDIIIISDCIYNPCYHQDLLKTIAATLKLPNEVGEGGGRAILSFSLHGNTPDEDIWIFVDKTVSETRCGDYQLLARPVKGHRFSTHSKGDVGKVVVEGRHGVDMEHIMQELGLWTAHVERKRWLSFLYEITWSKI